MSERSETLTQARPPVLRESHWSVSVSGLSTVYRLELRQRLRSRWLTVTVVIWFLVLAALTTLIYLAVGSDTGPGDDPDRTGATMFGVVAILVLSLAALISPALSATSINGDRAHGVLAALQSTLLTPAELVIGKLLAAWTSALILIATALPFLIWAFVLGGTTVGRLIVTLVLIPVTLLVVCAIGLGCSALAARTSASAAQTYLLVTLLGIGLPLLFLLTLSTVTTTSTKLRPEYTYGYDGQATGCRMALTSEQEVHSEYTWWLLAASPYVVVSDASPGASGSFFDPLSEIRNGVRSARLGDELRDTDCSDDDRLRAYQAERDQLPPTWPYGLAIDLAIGGLFTVLAIRRLRTPARKLPRDTRVA